MPPTDSLTFTPEDAEKLARGWPNLIVPIDGDKRDKSAAKSARNAYCASDPILFVEWPRETLHRFVRAGGLALFSSDATKTDTTAKMDEAMSNANLLTPSEALDALARVFRAGGEHRDSQTHEFVYGVEAIAGTDDTLARITDEIEAYTPTKKESAPFNLFAKGSIADTLGFLFLRASPAVVKSARKRLADALACAEDIVRTKKLGDDFFGYIIGLDISLNGAAGVKRANTKYLAYASGEHVKLDWLEYAADDPAWVRECWAIDPKQPMSVRIPYIAGVETLVGLEKRKWRAIELPSIVRDFGMIRSPLVLDFILSLVGKTAAKEAPLAWFRAHAKYARPILEKKAKSGATAASAMLRALSAP